MFMSLKIFIILDKKVIDILLNIFIILKIKFHFKSLESHLIRRCVP